MAGTVSGFIQGANVFEVLRRKGRSGKMVAWVENKVAPDTIVASGTNFPSTLGTLTGLPTTRSRPLCPFPKTLRYVGGDMALATSYACHWHRWNESI